MGCRDVISQETCTLYQPQISYTTRKRTSEDARFFRSLEVRYFEQPQHVPSQAAGQTAQGEGGPCPHTPAEAAEKVDTIVYIWYNVIIKYRRWHYG